MDDLNRSISNYVKSGQYYADARAWYANKFIFALTQRTYITFILSIFAFSLLVLGFFYSITEPASPVVNYKVNSEDIARDYSVIFPAGKSTEKPQLQITKYMLANYVKKRESYQFGHTDDQLNFVKNTTVGTEYLKYENMMSINNPVSPLMIYQDANVKLVKIKDVQILKVQDDYIEGAVYFTSTVRNIASNRMDSFNMVSKINFKIDNIEELLKQNAKKLNFLVLEYNLKEDK
jgi:type IV secretion system protein VirB8